MATSVILNDAAQVAVYPVTLEGTTIHTTGLPLRCSLGDLKGYFTAAGSLPVATTTTAGVVKMAAAQADAAAAPTQADFNGLLAKLRTAGILST